MYIHTYTLEHKSIHYFRVRHELLWVTVMSVLVYIKTSVLFLKLSFVLLFVLYTYVLVTDIYLPVYIV